MNSRLKEAKIGYLTEGQGILMEALGELYVHKIVDRRWDRNWMAMFRYQHKIIKDGPDEIAVAFSTKIDSSRFGDVPIATIAIMRQVTYTKTITITKASPVVRVSMSFHNFGTDVPITPWIRNRITHPDEPRGLIYYLPSPKGIQHIVATHARGSAYDIRSQDPGEAWIGYLRRDFIGAAAWLDDPGMLDYVMVESRGGGRGDDHMGMVCNQFVTNVNKGDLVIGYSYAPLQGLGRLDGVDDAAAYAIKLASDRSAKLWKPDWQTHTQTTLKPRAGGHNRIPCPWMTGDMAKAEEKVNLDVRILPWASGNVDVQSVLRTVEGKVVEEKQRQASFSTLKVWTWERQLPPLADGTYVVRLSVKQGEELLSEFERPFVVGQESAKEYAKASKIVKKGKPFVSGRTASLAPPKHSICEGEKKDATPQRGPFLFQIAEEKLNKVWPGMTAISPRDIYGKKAAYGWTARGTVVSPRKTAQTPDFLGVHGVYPAGGNKVTVFQCALEEGAYEIAILSNDMRDPHLLRKFRDVDIKAQGENVYKDHPSQEERERRFYAEENHIVGRRFDVWDDYLAPHIKEISFPVNVKDGPLKLEMSGSLFINAILIYPAERKDRLKQVLASLAKERKRTFRNKDLDEKFKAGVPPTAEDRELGYRLIALQSLSNADGFGADKPGLLRGGPLPNDLERTFDLVTGQDGWLSVRVGVQPFKDLQGCRLRMGEVKNEEGDRFAADNIRTGVWKYLPTPVGLSAYSLRSRLLRMPHDIEYFKNISIDEGVNRYYWVTLRIPPDTKPGVYSGDVVFEADNAASKSMPLRFRVYPFRLRRPLKNWWYCMYIGAPGMTLERYLDDVHEHGNTTLRVFPYKKPDGDYGFRTRFGASLEDIEVLAAKKGYAFNYAIMHVYDRSSRKPMARLVAKNDPTWRDALKKEEDRLVIGYKKYIGDFKKIVDKDLWIIEFVGEGVQVADDIPWIKAAYRAIRRAGGAKAVSYQWGLAWKEPLAADVFLVNSNHVTPYFTPAGMKLRKAHGMDTCLHYYVNSRYASGYGLHVRNLQGGTNEGLGWSGSLRYPHNVFDGFYGRWMKSLSSSRGVAPVFNRSWEDCREGLTDYSFLDALLRECAGYRASGKKDAARVAQETQDLIAQTLEKLASQRDNQDAYDLSRRVFADKVMELRAKMAGAE